MTSGDLAWAERRLGTRLRSGARLEMIGAPADPYFPPAVAGTTSLS
jgi:hypothetical protein